MRDVVRGSISDSLHASIRPRAVRHPRIAGKCSESG